MTEIEIMQLILKAILISDIATTRISFGTPTQEAVNAAECIISVDGKEYILQVIDW